MKLKVPEWLYKDPLAETPDNREMSGRELGRRVTLSLIDNESPDLAALEGIITRHSVPEQRAAGTQD